MRRILLLSLLCLSGVWTACSLTASENRGSQGYHILLPWSADGKYAFEVVSLETLADLATLTGRTATFTYGFNGPAPRVRTFERGDGVFVPSDNISQRLITLYAHLEKIRELTIQSGVQNEVTQQPLKVAVQARLLNLQQDGFIENNAQFNPVYNAMLFAPTTSDDLPLMVNGGVIAHEYFHAIFNEIVLAPLRKSMATDLKHEGGTIQEAVNPHTQSRLNKSFGNERGHRRRGECPRGPEMGGKITGDLEKQLREIYQVRLLRAMNEGLADFWGWIYSGDTRFVGRSRPEVREMRDLDADNFPVMSYQKFKQDNAAWGVCGRYSGQAFVYDLGVQYAHWLKQAFHGWERPEVAKLVIKVMPKLMQVTSEMNTKGELKPAHLIELFAIEVKESHGDLCEQLLSRVEKSDLRDPNFACKKQVAEAPAAPSDGGAK